MMPLCGLPLDPLAVGEGRVDVYTGHTIYMQSALSTAVKEAWPGVGRPGLKTCSRAPTLVYCAEEFRVLK